MNDSFLKNLVSGFDITRLPTGGMGYCPLFGHYKNVSLESLGGGIRKRQRVSMCLAP